MPPDPPTLWCALHAIPHPIGKFGQTGFVLLPMVVHVYVHCSPLVCPMFCCFVVHSAILYCHVTTVTRHHHRCYSKFNHLE